MTDLATRLKAATEGSRELSDLVLLALGWRAGRINWRMETEWFSPIPKGMEPYYGTSVPHPTRSVDDGLALAGDDWAAILGEAFDQLCELDQALGGDFTLARLPLFICAALVRAKEQETASE